VTRTESFGANAFAQVLRGGTQVLTTSALPLICAPFLAEAEYQAWVLITGLALLVTYADFGLQSSVGAAVARLLAAGKAGESKRLVRAVLVLLAVGLVPVIGATVGLGHLLPVLFSGMHDATVADARTGLLLLAVGLWVNVLTAILMNWFMADKRALRIVIVVAPLRVVTACLVVAIAYLSGSLVLCAAAVAGGALVTLAITFTVFERSAHTSSSVSFAEGRRHLAGLRRQTGALAVWSLTTAMVSSLDTTVVGAVDYSAIASYGVAISILASASGFIFALQSPLVTWFVAATHRSHEEGVALMRRVTAVCSALLGLGFAAVVAVLSLGSSDAVPVYLREGRSFLLVLTAALVIRISLNPLCLYLLATGATRELWVPQVVEGALKLGLSVALGMLLGARGVALATVIASVVGFLTLLRLGLAKIPSGVAPASLLRRDVLGPAAFGVGAAMVAMIGYWQEELAWLTAALVLVAVVARLWQQAHRFRLTMGAVR
jgi:O-antigen/teichoic acid export membrane protein